MAIAGSSLSSLAPLSKVGTEYSGTASIIWARDYARGVSN